jgi:DDE domain
MRQSGFPVWPDVTRRDPKGRDGAQARLCSVAVAFGQGVCEGQRQALLLWRAADHEGDVLEAVVAARRDKAAALKILKRIMRTYGQPQKIVTDGLCSCSAANEIGNANCEKVGRRLNNRAKNSHPPFRRRESAMQHFRSVKTLQTPRSATISIRRAISSPASSAGRDAMPHWAVARPRGLNFVWGWLPRASAKRSVR